MSELNRNRVTTPDPFRKFFHRSNQFAGPGWGNTKRARRIVRTREAASNLNGLLHCFYYMPHDHNVLPL